MSLGKLPCEETILLLCKKKSDRSEPTTQESIYEADDHKSVWNLISRESVQALLHQRILELLV
jgi:hypothetical protein